MFTLHKDEKVILYIRRHWVFLVSDAAKIFTLFLFPVVIIWIAQIWKLVPDINLLGVSVIAASDILTYLWGLFCWMLLAEKFTDYSLDFWVVTNKRIIESELIKLFDVRISTLELEDIEDLTIRNQGFWANVFGWGRLDVQTAGAVNEFYADKILNPTKVQKIIFDAKVAYRQEQQDIEKVEFEQISKRVFKEGEFEENKKGAEFDWAMIDEKQEADERNRSESIPEVDLMYKKNVDNALRSGE